MKTMTKKLLVSLCAALMLCMAMAGYASADTMVLDTTLDLSNATANISNFYYEWDSYDNALTIVGDLTIESDAEGIILPEDAILKVQRDATLTIVSKGDAIYCAGTLEMTVDEGCTVDITSTDYDGISVNGTIFLYIDSGASMTITANSVGVYDRSNPADSANTSSIACDGTLKIDVTTGIYLTNNLELSGSGTINIVNSYCAMDVSETITFASSNTLTITTDSYIYGAGNGGTYELYYTDLNTALKTVDGEVTSYTICGDYTPYGNNALSDAQAVNLDDGAELTISAGQTIDLSGCTSTSISYGTGSVVNNGTLILPAEPNSFSAFSGDGTIMVPTDIAGVYDVYDNDGVYLYTTNDIILTDAEVLESAGLGYTWIKGSDDVYTLTIFSGTLVGNLEIEVADAIVNLTQDTTVENIYFGDDTALTNLTITGAYTLTVADEGIGGIGSLTIGEGTTVITPSVYFEVYEFDEGGRYLGELFVNGTLQANFVTVGGMTVSNTGSVVLTYDADNVVLAEMDLDDLADILGLADAAFLYCSPGMGAAPTVTLGSEIAVLSPAGAYFDTVEMMAEDEGVLIATGIYYGFFYTSDGELATSITIGKKPSTDSDDSTEDTSTSTVTTTTVTTTTTTTTETPTSPATGEVGIVAWFVAWVAAIFA